MTHRYQDGSTRLPLHRGLTVQVLALTAFILGALLPPLVAADTSRTQQGSPGHMKVSGVVTDERSGLLTVKTPVGSLMLNEKASVRHGHAVPKVGDEVTIWVNENNTVIDVHPKGHEGQPHRFITGNLVYVGKMKKQIKLWTPEGEQVFPLERLEVKTGAIEEGALVTVELNEAGTVIDLHRAEGQGNQPKG